MNHPEFSAAEREALVSLAVIAVETLLKRNICKIAFHPVPVLLAGASYPGVWLEHNQDNIFLAEFAPENAWATQEIFLKGQREDGLLPFCVPRDPGSEFFRDPVVYWQVQTVFPFVRCAVTVADRCGRPEEDYRRVYEAGCRYDRWFGRCRNRAGTGLVEMYCEYDTGHDNSPRVTDGGIPHSCPGNEASNMPDLPCMPILSADLSATRYGGRIALAELAGRLGLDAEAARWREEAAELRAGIQRWCYDPETDFYYDRDREGWRRYRSEHITRLFLNHVVDQEEFDHIYHRYFESPDEFDTPFPFPSMAASDPSFVRECPSNCWGANSQALTALRALFWLPEYGRADECDALLGAWAKLFIATGGEFCQEVNPFTRQPLPSAGNYTPAMLLCIEAAKRFGDFDPVSTARRIRRA